MLEPGSGFTPLPGEQRLYTSPARTALSIASVNKFPGKQPFTLSSSAGKAYLTNRRVWECVPLSQIEELTSSS